MEQLSRKNAARHEQALDLFQSGQLLEARKLYSAICRKGKRDDRALAMLGMISGQLGELEEAAQYLRRATVINPQNLDAYINLGYTHYIMGYPEKAVPCYEKALKLSPGHATVPLVLLGSAYAKLDQLTRAEDMYRQALLKEPANAVALGNLANVLAFQGRPDSAIECYRKALEINPRQPATHSNMLLCLHYSLTIGPEQIYQEHLDWAARHADNITHCDNYAIDRDPDRKLRIGYVTPDLRGHSVAYFIEPLLREHDRTRFEIYCYVEVGLQDDTTKRLWKLADSIQNTAGRQNEEVVAMVQHDGIDILIDLAGHTENNRLPVFARKPAPIQMTYLGYPDTTGMSAINYRITDHWADPKGMTEHLNSEELLRLEHGFMSFMPPAESPPVSFLPAKKIGHVTFGSFNVLTKITPEMLEVWAQILQEVPNSRLFIKNRQLSDSALCERVIAQISGHGIDPERIELAGKTSKEEHMASYGKVDIALDSFPYHGTTTTCDTLWMGIPVITLAGTTHVSRVGVSILARVDLDDLVCKDKEEYIRSAIALSSDFERLSNLRSSLRSRMKNSTLCDNPLFAREFESLLRTTWRKFCARMQNKPMLDKQ